MPCWVWKIELKDVIEVDDEVWRRSLDE